MRYRRLIAIGAVVAACGALGAAPALAGQPSSAHPALRAVHPSHAVVVPHTPLFGEGCDVMGCNLVDAGGAIVDLPNTTTPAVFFTPVLGHVHTNPCWPFSDCHFDTLYGGNEVLQFVVQNTSDCMQTDSVHSTVYKAGCGSHDAGTYWMSLGSSPRGVCQAGGFATIWLVNVGITNNYPVYPYGEALFNNSGLLAVATHQAISNSNQWCTTPSG